MNDKSYSTDLTDQQWQLISVFFRRARKGGESSAMSSVGSLMGAFMFSVGYSLADDAA